MKIPLEIENIIQRFKDSSKNYEVYLVGGCVRDLLLNRQPKDWDFTTNLTPEEMKKLFPKNSFYNNKFGTFSVVGKNGEVFEITTFRTDVGYSDGRHPDRVKWGKSLAEDVARRDFTINAIAISLKPTIKIIDLFGGRKDLENKLVKTVGDPDQRFAEDGLRLMRAVRIASQLGFEIEEKTLKSIQKNAKLINNISGERVRDELFKLLLSPTPSVGIELLRQSGLLKEIMPELLDGVEMAQKGHHINDVWTHNLKTLDNCQSKNPITRLAALLHDVGKPKSMKGKGEARTFHNHEITVQDWQLN